MNKIKKLFKQNTLLDFLVAIFLSHIFYNITFIDSLSGEFDVINQIRNRDLISTSFFIESPTYTLMGLIFGIENIDLYKILIYSIFLFSLYLIVYNIQFLESYSTIFVLGGWLITCSWFLGYVDILSVVLIVSITKHIVEENLSYKTFFLLLLLSVNHNAISLTVCLILLILVHKSYRFNLFKLILISQFFGNIIIQVYLNFIGFSGRGRLRFIFNDNVMENASRFVGENIFVVIWSGFLGSSLTLLFIFNLISWDKVKMIIFALLVSLFFTSIALDTSRIFSLLVIPIIIFSLNQFKNNINLKSKLSYIYTLSVPIHFLIGKKYFYGNSLTNSPMNNDESFYNFVARIVNFLMKNIWN
mgnify:FL=1